jgi:hypothetical protein
MSVVMPGATTPDFGAIACRYRLSDCGRAVQHATLGAAGGAFSIFLAARAAIMRGNDITGLFGRYQPRRVDVYYLAG